LKTALIGFTGFVGANLRRKHPFDDSYNSSNIAAIKGQSYDLVICAAPSSLKWKANKFPKEDAEQVSRLMAPLGQVRCERFVLVSTLDVYPDPVGVDEAAPIVPAKLPTYGKNRFRLQQFVQGCFEKTYILRVGHLYGRGLKKNFLFDLLYDNCLHLTHRETTFQFYCVDHLWDDIQTVLEKDLPLVNLTPEPTSAREIARNCFEIKFQNETNAGPLSYDVRSRYGQLLGWGGDYRFSKKEVFSQIQRFVEAFRAEADLSERNDT